MPPVSDSGEPLLCDLDAADAQQRRDMTCVKYSAALAAVACATYLGSMDLLLASTFKYFFGDNVKCNCYCNRYQ